MCHADYVAAVYSEMRAEEVAQEVPHSYTTARTLLSILRLSQALARLRFAKHVDQVCTALHLLACMTSTHNHMLSARVSSFCLCTHVSKCSVCDVHPGPLSNAVDDT